MGKARGPSEQPSFSVWVVSAQAWDGSPSLRLPLQGPSPGPARAPSFLSQVQGELVCPQQRGAVETTSKGQAGDRGGGGGIAQHLQLTNNLRSSIPFWGLRLPVV